MQYLKDFLAVISLETRFLVFFFGVKISRQTFRRKHTNWHMINFKRI